jgi:hypothetical protein
MPSARAVRRLELECCRIHDDGRRVSRKYSAPDSQGMETITSLSGKTDGPVRRPVLWDSLRTSTSLSDYLYSTQTLFSNQTSPLRQTKDLGHPRNRRFPVPNQGIQRCRANRARLAASFLEGALRCLWVGREQVRAPCCRGITPTTHSLPGVSTCQQACMIPVSTAALHLPCSLMENSPFAPPAHIFTGHYPPMS